MPEEKEDPWRDDFRTPSPTFSDLDDNQDVPTITDTGYADLRRELDLSMRIDHADYKETPFTLAAQRKGRSQQLSQQAVCNIKAATERNKKTQVDPIPASSSRDSQKQTNQAKSITSYDTKPTANQIPPRARIQGPKPAGRRELPPDIEPKPRIRGQWRDSSGNIIPDDPPPPPSLARDLEKFGEEQEKKEKRNEARRIANRRKKAKKARDQESITYHMIPKGAGPTDEYPIVKGLEKQKSLPAKKKKTAATAKEKRGKKVPIPSPSPPPKRKISKDLIDELVTGVPAKKTKFLTEQEHCNEAGSLWDQGQSEASRVIGELAAATRRNNSTYEGLEHPLPRRIADGGSILDKYRSRWEPSSEKAVDGHSAVPSSNRKDDLPHPLNPRTPAEGGVGSHTDQPSTISCLPSSVADRLEKDDLTSSSVLPYSSPLADHSRSNPILQPTHHARAPQSVPNMIGAQLFGLIAKKEGKDSSRKIEEDWYMASPAINTPKSTTGDRGDTHQLLSPDSEDGASTHTPLPDVYKYALNPEIKSTSEYAQLLNKEGVKTIPRQPSMPKPTDTTSGLSTSLTDPSPSNTVKRPRTPPRSIKLFTPKPASEDKSGSSRPIYTVHYVKGDKYGPERAARAVPYSRQISVADNVNRPPPTTFVGQPKSARAEPRQGHMHKYPNVDSQHGVPEYGGRRLTQWRRTDRPSSIMIVDSAPSRIPNLPGPNSLYATRNY
ncbi:hypothetical protein CI109_100835 [Kwoniella shandongensis]|uniref:Uncharacterized protein n=1 Tax=Kwoniella shandongensis TaxID=1734106 RepID=A0A5M6BRM6_9TREE|nr:uncharacterized protein CI109_006925 [Kwoniella shandongensis]KAA5524771.1 hypothetical protein CI109_006925 [Kwoniella shandongensis]